MKDVFEPGTSYFMKCGRCGRANNTEVEFYYHHRWTQNLCEHCFKIESKGDFGMGAYVNPTDMSKEKWLLRNAKEVHSPMTWEEVPENFFPVILVDNGWMTAAGIAYKESELVAFIDPGDPRPKRYFLAPIHRLHEVSSELDEYMERG